MAVSLAEPIRAAVKAGQLLESAARNIALLLEQAPEPVHLASVRELIDASDWSELNDRFFTTLAFGTGGLRGRTIGKVVTKAEQGKGGPLGRPEHPCVGTNAMNFYNVERATRGLVAYLWQHFSREGKPGRPKLAIAHDTRHFSPEFCALAAKVASEQGCDVVIFQGPRSTPELSFAVRHTGATAGIVLTASHNPPHDNGYKVYFSDGAQIVEPHASGIINEVNSHAHEHASPMPLMARGKIEKLAAEVDAPYLERLQTLILDPRMLEAQRERLHVVFTSIHGTGGVISLPAFQALGIRCTPVTEQEQQDGRFPSVKSPNPENAEALSLGMKLADEVQADVIIGTDPDCDRMGAAVRGDDGKLQIVTGNQIGSLLAWYRIQTLFAQGVLTQDNRDHACIIKTFVTTDLQRAIADHYGLRCVETLTGFKYIGAKLGKYERALPGEIRMGYRDRLEAETRSLRLRHSTFFVFGGEESYGYSGADFVRDKDGNAAAIMFAEVCAAAKARGQTVPALLDAIYAQFGFFDEKNGAIQMEGAEGAASIQRLLASYEATAPTEIGGTKVVGVKNFAREDVYDVEGDLIPKEKMLLYYLDGGGRVAVRGSGTEPKIKYYLFGSRAPESTRPFTPAELASAKTEVRAQLDAWWDWLQADADQRRNA